MNRKKHISKGIRPIVLALILFAVVLLVGSTGYMFLDPRFTFVEALYMTVITISTVGFQEIHPLTDASKIFTIGLIITSVAIYGYLVSIVSSFVIEGAFRKNFKSYRVHKKMKRKRGHVIVCGYGRNGKQATVDLEEQGQDFVVIDLDEEVFLEVEKSKGLFVLGDATDENVLLKARVEYAKALITTMPSDALNTFVVLTARELNPHLKIISRCSEIQSESKLRRAGADNIIMPDIVGGQKMARLVTQPDIVEFLDKVLLQSVTEVNLEEVFCDNLASSVEGKTIKELNLRKLLNINIVGMRNEDGTYIYNPPSDTVVANGKQLFVLAESSQILALRRLLLSGQ